jgi:STE24 endopeptidase
MNTYFVIIISLILAKYLFNLVIEIVNLMNVTETPPPQFQEVPIEKYKKAQRYLKDNTLLEIAFTSTTTLVLLAMVFLGGFNLIDLFARSFGYSSIPTGLIFFAIVLGGLKLIQIPFDLVDTFVIEEKYGFNKMTLAIFIADLIKQTAIFVVVGGLFITALLWFFENMGPYAWLYCWLLFTLFQLAITYITPIWIMPLFNKFTPIPDGDLKEAIEAYAKEQRFALQGIFTMDGSQRSSKSNAFFTGFGKNRRIVLFDTLIARHTQNELLSILAHEVGHYKRKHILKFFLISIVNSGLILYLFSWFLNNPGLFQAFGMKYLSVYASFVFFGFLYSPFQILISIGANALSRHYEYEADAYAVESYGKPDAMIDALKKLAIDNMSNLTPHPWKVAVSYSHPTVVQRIKAIESHLKA